MLALLDWQFLETAAIQYSYSYPEIEVKKMAASCRTFQTCSEVVEIVVAMEKQPGGCIKPLGIGGIGIPGNGGIIPGGISGGRFPAAVGDGMNGGIGIPGGGANIGMLPRNGDGWFPGTAEAHHEILGVFRRSMGVLF